MFDFDEIEEDVSKQGAGSWTETKSTLDEAKVASDIRRLTVGDSKPKGPPLPELPSSEWIGSYRRNPEARLRLFVVLGVGCPAATYTEWVSPEIIQRYPYIEVVVLELPGHGFNSAPAFYDVGMAGKGIAAEITRLQFHGQARKDPRRPFALYGFSMGAMLLWDASRRICGGEGETCLKLYVACRGGPHLTSGSGLSKRLKERLAKQQVDDKKDKEDGKKKDEAADEKPTKRVGEKKKRRAKYNVKTPKFGEKPDFSKEDPEELFDMAMDGFEQSVDEEQVKKYDRYLGMLVKKDPKKLCAFVETQFADNMIAGVGVDIKKQDPLLPIKVQCPMMFYCSDSDEVWPEDREEPETTLNKGLIISYDDLPESWERYAGAGFESKMYANIGHGEMGSPQTPLFHHMMADLSKLVRERL